MNQALTPVICEKSFADFKEMAGDATSMILTAYIDSATQAVEGILGAAEAGDAVTVCRHAHSVKSASAQIGALPFSELAAETEEQAMGESVEKDLLQERAKQMVSAFEAVKNKVMPHAV